MMAAFVQQAFTTPAQAALNLMPGHIVRSDKGIQ